MLIKIIFIIPRGLINMNKNDIILFVVLVSIVSIFVVIISFFNNPQEKIAVVYSNQKEVLRIPLNLQNNGKEFVVEGYNGDVVLEVKNKKFGLKKKYHLIIFVLNKVLLIRWQNLLFVFLIK